MAVSKQNTRVLVTISKRVKAQADGLAAREQSSVSCVCGRILSDYFAGQKGGEKAK